jgi:probable aminopeptidase NPEPL1
MPSSALATAPSTPRRPVVGAASAQPGGRKNRVVRRRSRPTRASSSTTPITNEDWEASSPIAFDASLDDALACDKVVVLGARASLTSPALVDALPPPIAAVWTDAVRLTPAGDGGGKRSLMVRVETNGEDGGSGTRLVEVVVGVLPPSVSRHNCSAAPFAVSTILAGVSAPADPARVLGIVTALRRDADAIPIATAVARCFPLYTAKSVAGRDTAEGRGKIAERGRVRVASVVVGKDATVASEVTPTSDAAAAAAAAARGVRFAGRLVDAPPAAMDPDAIVREAEAVVARLRATLASNGGAGATISSDVLRYDALKRGGFGGLVAVGDAAARDGREPALVHVKYTPPPPSGGESDAQRVVALVGKGITFDTGGLQIKGKSGMPGMKSDMGGAAAMLAAFEAVCVLRPAHLRELHLVLCVAENAVGPAAFRPDDVVVPLRCVFFTLVPIRPRWRGERRSLRLFPAFLFAHPSLSIPTHLDAFQLRLTPFNSTPMTPRVDPLPSAAERSRSTTRTRRGASSSRTASRSRPGPSSERTTSSTWRR